jgi:hypothetical protein
MCNITIQQGINFMIPLGFFVYFYALLISIQSEYHRPRRKPCSSSGTGGTGKIFTVISHVGGNDQNAGEGQRQGEFCFSIKLCITGTR